LSTTLQKTWIKICCMTRHEDASLAVRLGADAIGLVFYPPSKRAVSPEQIDDIVGDLHNQALVVGLFVNPDKELVDSVIASGKINCLQFHGSEPVSFCESFSMPYIKVFRVGESEDLVADIIRYASADYILLDSFDSSEAGGTGQTFDWSAAAASVSNLDIKLVIAGGLSCTNLAEAIDVFKPFGVDVCSGVEARKGIKDRGKMREFIEGAKHGV